MVSEYYLALICFSGPGYYYVQYSSQKTCQTLSLKIQLKYSDKNQPVLSGLERISKPGLRVYVERTEIPRVSGGLGVAILSTSKGVMTGQQAWRQGIGGEILCYVL